MVLHLVVVMLGDSSNALDSWTARCFIRELASSDRGRVSESSARRPCPLVFFKLITHNVQYLRDGRNTEDLRLACDLGGQIDRL